jgi:tetratricopeptide (TPR) repeat protein
MREAERAFASALTFDAGLVAALRNRYLAIYRMGGAGDTAQLVGEKLEDACNNVLGRRPASAAEYSNLGDAYSTCGRHALGTAAYQAALDLDPGNPWLKRRLTWSRAVQRPSRNGG